MYIPEAFATTELNTLHDFIERHSFGLLVSQIDGVPFATHLPFLLDKKIGRFGCLIGHMARTNPQWKHLAGQSSLAIFSGPHAYISPTWYEAEQVVPTWNYIAVHAYGRAEVIEVRAELLEIVQRSVAIYESTMPKPWSFDGSATFIERLLAQIVGFRIAIESIDGKWKLNQNHPIERRLKVIEALDNHGGENARAIADSMRLRYVNDQ